MKKVIILALILFSFPAFSMTIKTPTGTDIIINISSYKNILSPGEGYNYTVDITYTNCNTSRYLIFSYREFTKLPRGWGEQGFLLNNERIDCNKTWSYTFNHVTECRPEQLRQNHTIKITYEELYTYIYSNCSYWNPNNCINITDITYSSGNITMESPNFDIIIPPNYFPRECEGNLPSGCHSCEGFEIKFEKNESYFNSITGKSKFVFKVEKAPEPIKTYTETWCYKDLTCADVSYLGEILLGGGNETNGIKAGNRIIKSFSSKDLDKYELSVGGVGSCSVYCIVYVSDLPEQKCPSEDQIVVSNLNYDESLHKIYATIENRGIYPIEIYPKIKSVNYGGPYNFTFIMGGYSPGTRNATGDEPYKYTIQPNEKKQIDIDIVFSPCIGVKQENLPILGILEIETDCGFTKKAYLSQQIPEFCSNINISIEKVVRNYSYIGSPASGDSLSIQIANYGDYDVQFLILNQYNYSLFDEGGRFKGYEYGWDPLNYVCQSNLIVEKHTRKSFVLGTYVGAGGGLVAHIPEVLILVHKCPNFYFHTYVVNGTALPIISEPLPAEEKFESIPNNTIILDDKTKLLVTLTSLEQLKLKFDDIKGASQSIANYYSTINNAKKICWNEITIAFEAISLKIDSIISEINKIKDNPTKNDLGRIRTMVSEMKSDVNKIINKIISCAAV